MLTNELRTWAVGSPSSVVLTLYDPHGEAIHWYASRLLVDPAAAERLTRQVFVQLATSPTLPSLDWTGRLPLYRWATRQARTPLRGQGLRYRLLGHHPTLPRVGDPTLWTALLHLTPSLRPPLILRSCEQLPLSSVAWILDLPPACVQARLATARQRVAGALAGRGSQSINL